MRPRIRFALLALAPLLLLLAAGGSAKAANRTADNLIGTWVLDSGAFTDPHAELITFRKQASIEAMHAGRLEAVGFWQLDDNTIKLNVLAPPGLFVENLDVTEGVYLPFEIIVAAFDIKDDAFEAIGVLGEQIRRAT
jgi:hypothetical protein